MAPIAAAAYAVETPPVEMLCQRKTPANLTALHQWVEAHAAAAIARHRGSDAAANTHEQHTESQGSPAPQARQEPATISEGAAPNSGPALVASVDMLIYGGLIASRSSNDSEATVLERVRWLADLPRRFPGLRLYLSTTVMRIPAYNEDFEEPWFWALYGADLYEYSFYSARFRALHNASDAAQAEHYKALVPASVLSKFLWRRARNVNATHLLLELQRDAEAGKVGVAAASRSGHVKIMSPSTSASPSASAQALYITLDDSGTYGINVEEANALRKQAEALNLTSVSIYPGADEVGAALLARLASDDMAARPTVALVWRAPNATGLVPNYENQAINLTVRAQLAASGAAILAEYVVDEGGALLGVHAASTAAADVVFLVNNFQAAPQLEASQQPAPSSRPASDYAPLTVAAVEAKASGAVLALADVRYSNGGDLAVLAWLQERLAAGDVDSAQLAYAGWNTDGNTLGTAAANAVLLARFAAPGAPAREAAVAANRRFTLLRIIEDALYQASVRSSLNLYVPAAGEAITDLTPDLDFYERYSFKPLRAQGLPWTPLLGLPDSTALERCFYPWKRTFEIGLTLGEG